MHYDTLLCTFEISLHFSCRVFGQTHYSCGLFHIFVDIVLCNVMYLSLQFYGERVEGELLFFDTIGCKDEQYALPSEKANTTEAKSASPVIVMVRRGGCNFVNKVKVAQRKGAKAVIVADTKGSLSSQKDVKKVIVSDDGWGESIKIPSLLLSEEDANFLISAGDGLFEDGASDGVRPTRTDGQGKETVILELVWSLPKDHAVQIDVWSTPSSTQSAKFLKEFAPYAHAFKDKIDFQPHYWVMSMARDFHEMCTDSTADFCAFDPDFGGKTTGKMVLQESVRQMCLWDTTKKLHSDNPHSGFYSPEWWSYIEAVPSVCPHEDTDDEHRFGESCSYKLMELLQVNIRQVKKCYDEKFNTILAHELVNRAWAPNAIIINKTRYSGSLDPELVTRAICTAFAATQPECENFLKNGQLIMTAGQGLTDRQIFLISAGVVLAFGSLCFLLLWFVVLPCVKQRWGGAYARFGRGRTGTAMSDSTPTAIYSPNLSDSMPSTKTFPMPDV
ncbi:PA domain protein [Toxoplasma gondii TgCatPRC2]|uniref:PA domain protein n=1 Tax=Toxoplasma gondii TgCatPRC2 TaxID=1130821 RepID=A0A151HQV3_TOXGO|nr:PA domain protein [Toxoplasma gondii TgCatPRC2]